VVSASRLPCAPDVSSISQGQSHSHPLGTGYPLPRTNLANSPFPPSKGPTAERGLQINRGHNKVQVFWPERPYGSDGVVIQLHPEGLQLGQEFSHPSVSPADRARHLLQRYRKSAGGVRDDRLPRRQIQREDIEHVLYINFAVMVRSGFDSFMTMVPDF
jgi:hypothetical protein